VTQFIETLGGAAGSQLGNLLGTNGGGTYVPLGLSMRFVVTVSGLSLGSWSACKGLKVDFEPEQVKETGNPYYKPVLFGRASYSRISLERAMNSTDSPVLQQWLRSELNNWLVNPPAPTGGNITDQLSVAKYRGTTATITLYDASGGAVTAWTLRGVYPASWTGPTLSADGQGSVARETLELVHEGFL
jgi:phage tail-like protein